MFVAEHALARALVQIAAVADVFAGVGDGDAGVPATSVWHIYGQAGKVDVSALHAFRARHLRPTVVKSGLQMDLGRATRALIDERIVGARFTIPDVSLRGRVNFGTGCVAEVEIALSRDHVQRIGVLSRIFHASRTDVICGYEVGFRTSAGRTCDFCDVVEVQISAMTIPIGQAGIIAARDKGLIRRAILRPEGQKPARHVVRISRGVINPLGDHVSTLREDQEVVIHPRLPHLVGAKLRITQRLDMHRAAILRQRCIIGRRHGVVGSIDRMLHRVARRRMENEVGLAGRFVVIIAIVQNIERLRAGDLQIGRAKATAEVHSEVIERQTALEILEHTARVHIQVLPASALWSQLNHAGVISGESCWHGVGMHIRVVRCPMIIPIQAKNGRHSSRRRRGNGMVGDMSRRIIVHKGSQVRLFEVMRRGAVFI